MIFRSFLVRHFSQAVAAKCVIIHPVSFPKYPILYPAKGPFYSSILLRKLSDWPNP